MPPVQRPRSRNTEPLPRHSSGLLLVLPVAEALLKATGLGLSGGLRRVTVSPPHTEARLLSWEGGGEPDAAWLSDLERGEGYRSALALLTDRPVKARVRTPVETSALLRG